MFRKLKGNNIEFMCFEDDFDVIPKPYPAKYLMPDWFKKLPPKTGSKGLSSSTIKRCAPFMDAMTMGWIIPLAADVEIHTNADASGVDYKWNFYKNMVENHGQEQVSHPKSPNPNDPKPPIKFLNYWAIKLPKGYSCMFMPPMNRPDPRFTCLSGVVDCDQYFEFINFPFFFHQPNFNGLIEAGTPLVQIIPFKRDSMIEESVVRPFTEADHKKLQLTRRQRSSHESLYRDSLWVKKVTR
jgi:hypothetical protein